VTRGLDDDAIAARPSALAITVPRVLLTYRDYSSFPDDGRRHEVLAGEHVVSPRPAPYHQVIAGRLFGLLDRAITRAGLGIALPVVTVQLAVHDVVEPDICVLLAPHGTRLLRSRVRGAPDLIVEVLSPGHHQQDKKHKKSRYAAAGVREYWIVDPRPRELEQLLLADGAYETLGTFAAQVQLAILPTVTIDLREVW